MDIFSLLFAFQKLLPSFEQILERNDSIVCMIELDSRHTINRPPPARMLPVLSKVKDVYLLWHSYCQDIAKAQRLSFGYRIDSLFVEIIEAIAAASFLGPTEKHPYVRLAMKKIDAIKILFMIIWETRSIDNKKYIAMSLKLDEIGRNLGGWSGQLTRQNPVLSKGKAGK